MSEHLEEGPILRKCCIFGVIIMFVAIITVGLALHQWTWVWVNSGSWQCTGSLACCSPWGHKESDMTEWLNWTELKPRLSGFRIVFLITVLYLLWFLPVWFLFFFLSFFYLIRINSLYVILTVPSTKKKIVISSLIFKKLFSYPT